MELKPGYKQTEVGVIPEDWDVVVLGDLMSFQNGVNADKRAYGSGISFINVLEVITTPHLQPSHIPGRVRLSRQQADNYAVRRGDCLFNRTSETQDEVGLSSVYIGDNAVVFGGFVIRGRPTTKRLILTTSAMASGHRPSGPRSLRADRELSEPTSDRVI